MLHLLAKFDKESEAKKGIVKLMLLHIRGDIDIEATSVSNINQATPFKGMQVVLDQPCAAQASQFADLVQMILELAKKQDITSICYLLDSNINSGHVENPCFPYASRKLCY